MGQRGIDMSDIVQGFRDSARPFLTYMLPTSYVVLVIMGYCKADVSFKEALGLLAPLVTMIMTYHFMKGTKRDSKS